MSIVDCNFENISQETNKYFHCNINANCNFENNSQETNKYFHCNIDGDDVQHQNE